MGVLNDASTACPVSHDSIDRLRDALSSLYGTIGQQAPSQRKCVNLILST